MAGEIKVLNAFQKMLHRLVMIRAVTAFFAPGIHHVDKALLKLTGGKQSLSEILGWNIIQVTTIGAKTGLPRSMPLVGIINDGKIALIASNFGREHNPGWYHNLKAHPECDVLFKGIARRYIARETSGGEYERYWQLAVSYYAGYEKYKKYATPRHIPVMVLELKT